MWVLVFIYFYDAKPYVETYDMYRTMAECFEGRDILASDVVRAMDILKSANKQFVLI